MGDAAERGIIGGGDSSPSQFPLADMPETFPLKQWNEQSERYWEYQQWFSGARLGEVKSVETDGSYLTRYPLHINSIRSFARKHASVLFGEVADSAVPLVKPLIKAKKIFDLPKKTPTTQATTDVDTSTPDDDLAMLCENVLNEIWLSSGGRAIQMENGELCQWMGGCVFQASYEPFRQDLTIPIVFKQIRPDYFLPIWSNENYWDLLECWVIYRITAQSALNDYGVAIEQNPLGTALYVAHYTREKYTITVDGKPAIQKQTDTNPITKETKQISMPLKDVPNPFKRIPFVYIPHLKEGDKYGSSFIEDVAGLLKEFNSRMADNGDAILNTVHRNRWMSNVTTSPAEKEIVPGVTVIDIGTESPLAKNPPNVETEDPPTLSDALVAYPMQLWNQMGREAHLGPIAYGEDEGSQRSALTLAFRMWPTTSHTRSERTFWTEGLNFLNWLALDMLVTIMDTGLFKIAGLVIPPDFRKRLQMTQDWAPQIPRDREQLVNELVLRSQAGHCSLDFALEAYGDVRNIEEEKARIYADLEKRADIAAKAAAKVKPATTAGSGADTQIQKPVADSGLSANA